MTTLARELARLGPTRKKPLIARERGEAARAAMEALDPADLVFLDETAPRTR